MKEASKTDIHRRAVEWEIPQSAASPLGFSNCPAGAQCHEPSKRFQIADVEKVAEIPFQVALGVVPHPVPNGKFLVVNPRGKTREPGRIQIPVRRSSILRWIPPDLVRGKVVPSHRFAERKREKMVDGAASGQTLSEEFRRQKVL